MMVGQLVHLVQQLISNLLGLLGVYLMEYSSTKFIVVVG
jgi:hypothetical protein